MSIEVQLRESTLTRAVSDAVQERLYYTCLPSSNGNYVDHVDVSKSRPPKLAPSGGGTLRLRMWLDVYVVTGQQLSGSANGPRRTTPQNGGSTSTIVARMSPAARQPAISGSGKRL